MLLIIPPVYVQMNRYYDNGYRNPGKDWDDMTTCRRHFEMVQGGDYCRQDRIPLPWASRPKMNRPSFGECKSPATEVAAGGQQRPVLFQIDKAERATLVSLMLGQWGSKFVLFVSIGSQFCGTIVFLV